MKFSWIINLFNLRCCIADMLVTEDRPWTAASKTSNQSTASLSNFLVLYMVTESNLNLGNVHYIIIGLLFLT